MPLDSLSDNVHQTERMKHSILDAHDQSAKKGSEGTRVKECLLDMMEMLLS